MRVPNAAHTDRPWRIREIAADFRVEDVWELPLPDELPFARVVEVIASLDPAASASLPARALFAARWKLGSLLGWDDRATGIGARVVSLRDRLPDDLHAAPRGPELSATPFESLYLLDDEWAAEIANSTVHGIVHIGCYRATDGTRRGQLAVYVKPNGLVGEAYMALIKPFRHLIVYPPMLREFERSLRDAVPVAPQR